MRILRRPSAPILLSLTLISCAPAEDALEDEAIESTSWRGDSPSQLRRFIDRQVGGLDKLVVPADDSSIPLPTLHGDGTPITDTYRYETTEAKRYLGKLLFHDPVRTVRINVNTNVNPPIVPGEPRDLPLGTAFGGTVSGSDPDVQRVVDATRQTGSCGSCHLGEAAGKAGAVLNFNTGGEGRGYTDAHGNFIVRRRPMSILHRRALHPEALFAGDTGVDALPTLTDIYLLDGEELVSTPARQKVFPLADAILETGRLDELDSVGRQSPSMIGFAFNNRLLLGGFAGESNALPGGLNPLNDPAQENLTLLLLDAHRMLDFQSAELQRYPAFVELFRQAFPREAQAAADCVQANAADCLNKLVNDDTVLRATASFLRTAVTRNTPFDHFLAGDNGALTARQRRGARLFFTPATQGGAGCFTCHSGPMLNKQPDDPDVAGVGELVDENFFNLGIGDHPVQALNALRRGNLDGRVDADGHPIHGEDTGRQEVTGNPDHAYKFRSLTLRQLKDARTFFHNGSFTSVRDVVRYFNRGVPQDPYFAGRAHTLERRFTHPRGDHAPRGLGLREDEIDALTDFLENGLYDPDFARNFQPTEEDLTYSNDLHGLAQLVGQGSSGAPLTDGRLISGRAIDNDDPLSRRDQGLEFLDVTAQLRVTLVDSRRHADHQTDIYRITNTSSSIVDTHLLVIARGLPAGVRVENRSGITRDGAPYRRVFLDDGVLMPGQSLYHRVELGRRGRAPRVTYSLSFLSGQGNP
jgi:cytochrome c peroxidase